MAETASNSSRALQASDRRPLVSDMPEHEVNEHRNVQEAALAGRDVVSRDEVRSALEYLRRSASQFGNARAKATFKANALKAKEAELFLASTEKTADAKKAAARAHPEWMEAASEEAMAVGEVEEIAALRAAAEQRCRLYQTQQADHRDMK